MKKENPNDPRRLRHIHLSLAALPAIYGVVAIVAGRPIDATLFLAVASSVFLWFIWWPVVEALPELRPPVVSPQNLELLHKTLMSVPLMVLLEYGALIVLFTLAPAAGLRTFGPGVAAAGLAAFVVVAHKGVTLFRPLFSTWPLRLLTSAAIAVVGVVAHQLALGMVHTVTRLDPGLFTHAVLSLTSMITVTIAWAGVLFALLTASGTRFIAYHAMSMDFIRPLVQIFWRQPRSAAPSLLDAFRWSLLCFAAYSFCIGVTTFALALMAPTAMKLGGLSSLIAHVDGYAGAACAGTDGARVIYTGGDSIVIARWSPAAGRYVFQRGLCQLATATD